MFTKSKGQNRNIIVKSIGGKFWWRTEEGLGPIRMIRRYLSVAPPYQYGF